MSFRTIEEALEAVPADWQVESLHFPIMPGHQFYCYVYPPTEHKAAWIAGTITGIGDNILAAIEDAVKRIELYTKE
jgi:hypothetical protein